AVAGGNERDRNAEGGVLAGVDRGVRHVHGVQQREARRRAAEYVPGARLVGERHAVGGVAGRVAGGDGAVAVDGGHLDGEGVVVLDRDLHVAAAAGVQLGGRGGGDGAHAHGRDGLGGTGAGPVGGPGGEGEVGGEGRTGEDADRDESL